MEKGDLQLVLLLSLATCIAREWFVAFCRLGLIHHKMLKLHSVFSVKSCTAG